MLPGLRTLASLLVPATAIPVVVAAVVPPGFDRLAAMPPRTRLALAERLDAFDDLPEADRRSIRELDAALEALQPEDRRRYLDLMGRYASWRRGLDPETRQQLDAATPDRRIALIRQHVDAAGPPESPGGDPTLWARSALLNPVPLYDAAALMRVWARLDDGQRRRIESAGSLDDKVKALARLGRDLGIGPAPAVRDAFRSLLADRVPFGQRRLREQFDPTPPPGEPAPTLDEVVSWLLDPALPAEGIGVEGPPSRPITASDLPEAIRAVLEGPGADRLAVRLAEVEYLRDLQPRPSSAMGPELAAFEAVLPGWYRGTLDPLPPEVARLRLAGLRALARTDPDLDRWLSSAAATPRPAPPGTTGGSGQPARGVAF